MATKNKPCPKCGNLPTASMGEAIREAAAAGRFQPLADRFGVGVDTVKAWARALGIKTGSKFGAPRRLALTADQRARGEEMKARGVSIQDMSRTLGVTRYLVKRDLFQLP